MGYATDIKFYVDLTGNGKLNMVCPRYACRLSGFNTGNWVSISLLYCLGSILGRLHVR